MITKTEKGNYGERMVLKYLTHCIPVKNIKQNKQGTDFLCGNRKIQVKFDKTIHKSRNLYFEIKEKSYPEQAWRKSPCNADIYFFITPLNLNNINNEEIIMYQVKMEDFKKIRKNYTPREIKPTSFGYVIPIRDIKHSKREYPKDILK